MRFIFCICLLSMHLIAQSQPVVRDLEVYLAQVRTDKTVALPQRVLQDVNHEKELLNVLFKQTSVPGDEFQFRVLDLVRLIGLKSRDAEARHLAVNKLVSTIGSKNARISGFASHAVSSFNKKDFSEVDSDSIVNYLRSGMPNLDILFKLAGYLDNAKAKDQIKRTLIQPLSPTAKWNARLALSRLGDEEATNFILEKISNAQVDDAFIYSLAPGLVYTRNPKIFRQLEYFLQSDEYLCSSSHPDSQNKILCAYRLLEHVATAIDKFPVQADEHGDLLVDNYQSALVTCRSWLKQNPEYKIIRDTM